MSQTYDRVHPRGHLKLSQSTRPNLLFLSIEDLNDYVEPLGGHPQVVTPNIKRLAEWGCLFPNTYASAPACSPSRTAVLFGRWPWDSGIYTNRQTWPTVFGAKETHSILGLLRNDGYETRGSGKMFFGGLKAGEWDDYLAEPKDAPSKASPVAAPRGERIGKLQYGPAEIDGPLYDERNAAYIMDQMKAGMEGQVWSFGLYRPHLPFIAPQRFFDLYPENVEVAPALKERIFDPFSADEIEGIPDEALRRIVMGDDLGERLYKTQQYNAFIRAYLASISYADFVLGQVLDKLEAEGLRDNTYIVLWSDHGFHFGEKRVFRKYTLWERSLRTPMIFAGPGIEPDVCERPVSNVDVGKTILALMGIDAGEAWDGTNLVPLLKGDREMALPPAVSVYCWTKSKTDKQGNQIKEPLFAWTVRDSRWRLVQYWRGGLELYDHSVDPYEHNNLVPMGEAQKLPEELRPIVDELQAWIPAEPAEMVERDPREPDDEGERDPIPHWARPAEY